MLCLPGCGALSTFRLDKYREALAQHVADVEGLGAFFVHFVDLERSLDDRERLLLERLLDYGEGGPVEPGDTYSLVVIPRPGTISPWSSKATDILHNCGLDAVRRVERGIVWHIDRGGAPLRPSQLGDAVALLHDRMTESVIGALDDAAALFQRREPERLASIPLLARGRDALENADRELGLALAPDELDYLVAQYNALGRDPTDVELMMFAQANSEHCRHKIFRADWTIDDEPQDRSLFAMIRTSYEAAPDGVLSAYADNAAVIAGAPSSRRLLVDPVTQRYTSTVEAAPIQLKVETHNHPTAISPFPGAATGAGGEIRDEVATGVGGRSKAGLCGFSVSDLRIPGFEQPWERDHGRPTRLASALQIMIDGPVGAAAFNNEFGRPTICGYFRTYEQAVGADAALRGYHKPIMIAGGMGNVRPEHVDKRGFASGARIVVLGGPAMRIGLGGGAASSVTSGSSEAELDFASVQRGNPEMQRRTQEVIDRCCALGPETPILSIHDVGAGGLSNAVPEILDDAGVGGDLELRSVPNDEPGMSPLAIWCNEAQERYVVALRPEAEAQFADLCARERCPWAVLGEATADQRLHVGDRDLGDTPVDVPMDLLLGKPPQMHRRARRAAPPSDAVDTATIGFAEAAWRVLRLPAVASKEFLITIADRTVGGLVARDPMVGPLQVPVADCGVTATDFFGYAGEAMAMGERSPVAVLDARAAGRMAVGEAITNAAAAPIEAIGQIRLSANWMASTGAGGDDAALFDTVRAVGEELCPQLGVAIPVGKDSLSMQAVWDDSAGEHCMRAPLSLIVTAFAPSFDIRLALTPALVPEPETTELVLIDLGAGRNRLGGSALMQVHARTAETPPDVDEPAHLRALFAAIQACNTAGLLRAYHDRSDGGLFACVSEMAFAGGCGVHIDLDAVGDDAVAAAFTEELGAVIQIERARWAEVEAILSAHGISGLARRIGTPSGDDQIRWVAGNEPVFAQARARVHSAWHETSYQLQALRDNPECAESHHEIVADGSDPGLPWAPSFEPSEDVAAASIATGARPRLAVLREQGVNGQIEMAAAFERTGFETVDVPMSDLLAGRASLGDFQGMVACGGFSYGDVLGGGGGWARSILYNARARDAFQAFFAREDTFALGVCNGCQMMAQLAELIPGTDHWPQFVRNTSEQFEGRLVAAEVTRSPSILFDGMEGSRIPIVAAHGEGRASWGGGGPPAPGRVALRYVDPWGQATETYPWNPNGSPCGVAGVTNDDGRFTIMMPHPERCFRSVQLSWRPLGCGEDAPWLRLFRNARCWLG
jgi:phosphoribosylformylglycinamidine synthase